MEGGRSFRDGVGCGLYDVRREHTGASLVREGRYDAGGGAARGDDQRRGTSRTGKRTRRAPRGNDGGYRCGGGGSAGRHRSSHPEGSMGDEGRFCTVAILPHVPHEEPLLVLSSTDAPDV